MKVRLFSCFGTSEELAVPGPWFSMVLVASMAREMLALGGKEYRFSFPPPPPLPLPMSTHLGQVLTASVSSAFLLPPAAGSHFPLLGRAHGLPTASDHCVGCWRIFCLLFDLLLGQRIRSCWTDTTEAFHTGQDGVILLESGGLNQTIPFGAATNERGPAGFNLCLGTGSVVWHRRVAIKN